MAKFVYKMQNILDIKQKIEDQAKSAFAIAADRLREEEEVYRQLTIKKQHYDEEYRDAVTGKLNFSELNLLRRGTEKVKEDMKQQLVNIRVANKNLDLARAKLDEAIKERKVYEKLKEKAFEEFKIGLNEAEKKEVDELVSYQHGSKIATGGE